MSDVTLNVQPTTKAARKPAKKPLRQMPREMARTLREQAVMEYFPEVGLQPTDHHTTLWTQANTGVLARAAQLIDGRAWAGISLRQIEQIFGLDRAFYAPAVRCADGSVQTFLFPVAVEKTGTDYSLSINGQPVNNNKSDAHQNIYIQQRDGKWYLDIGGGRNKWIELTGQINGLTRVRAFWRKLPTLPLHQDVLLAMADPAWLALYDGWMHDLEALVALQPPGPGVRLNQRMVNDILRGRLLDNF